MVTFVLFSPKKKPLEQSTLDFLFVDTMTKALPLKKKHYSQLIQLDCVHCNLFYERFQITYLSILSTPPKEGKERKEGRKEAPDSVGD
jgi:hypothetical protein